MSTVVAKLYIFFQNFKSTYTKIPNLEDLLGKDLHLLSFKKKSNTYITFNF